MILETQHAKFTLKEIKIDGVKDDGEYTSLKDKYETIRLLQADIRILVKK